MPMPDQEKAHKALTVASRSGDAFIEFILSAPTDHFDLHTGVLARMCDLPFGSERLSILHL